MRLPRDACQAVYPSWSPYGSGRNVPFYMLSRLALYFSFFRYAFLNFHASFLLSAMTIPFHTMSRDIHHGHTLHMHHQRSASTHHFLLICPGSLVGTLADLTAHFCSRWFSLFLGSLSLLCLIYPIQYTMSSSTLDAFNFKTELPPRALKL